MYCLIKTTSATLQHLQEVPVWSALLLLLTPSNVSSLQCRTLILFREALNTRCEATGRNTSTGSMAAD